MSSVVQHPGKNLLLRAVAEAQKSTSQAFTNELKMKQRSILIHVPANKRNARKEEEYVPEVLSGRSESEAEYHPTHRRDNDEDDGDVVYLNNNDVDLDDLEADNEMQQQQRQLPHQSPTFIVSLDNVYKPPIDENSKSSKSPTPPPVILRNKRKSVRDRIGIRPIEQLMPLSEEPRPPKRRHFEEETEEEECESQRAYNKVKRTRVSPITFDLTDEENEDGKSRSSSCDRSQKKTPTKDKNNSVEKDNRENGEEYTKRIRLEGSRSFDHVPACKKL